MRVALTGSSGLIGSALTQHLRGSGAEVVSLVRRPPRSPSERQWAPDSLTLDPDLLPVDFAPAAVTGAATSRFVWAKA